MVYFHSASLACCKPNLSELNRLIIESRRGNKGRAPEGRWVSGTGNHCEVLRLARSYNEIDSKTGIYLLPSYLLRLGERVNRQGTIVNRSSIARNDYTFKLENPIARQEKAT